MEPVEKTDTDQNENSKHRDANGRWQKGHIPEGATPFQPGESGNPGGRPQTKHLTAALLKHLEKPVKELEFLTKIAKKLKLDIETATGFEVLMACAAHHAATGKGDILKQVWERLEGSIPKVVTLGPTDDFADYLDAMREKTQFDSIEEPKESPDADTG